MSNKRVGRKVLQEDEAIRQGQLLEFMQSRSEVA
jgi:hypothetical protein